MKKIFFLILVVTALLLCSCNIFSSPAETDKPHPEGTTDAANTEPPENDEPHRNIIINHNKMKAMWLSQFDLQNVYTKDGKQRDEAEYKVYIDQILQNIADMGFNTVILQIRPYADSFYPSEIYPSSKYAVGSYANTFSYDPLVYIIQKSHEKNMSVQAWINPLRCMTEEEIKQVDDIYQLKKWYNSSETNGKYVVSYNKRLYLNPAYADVRNLIIDGTNEILTKYAFDGIHMDDYFYPTTNASFDKAAYDEYVSSNGPITLKQFRYNALNTLVSQIYSAVKTNNKEKLFGISPAGNMNTVINDVYADVYTWCSNEGYIDYICPQVYFGLEHQTHPFDKTLDKWSDIIKTDSVKLIAGLTLGKAFSKEDAWAGNGKQEWAQNNDVIKKCIEYTAKNKRCVGVSFFCYQYFFDPLTNTTPETTKQEIENMLPSMNNIYGN